MTRDEAYKIVNKGNAENSLVVFHAAGFIDCLIQLGVLKLDEAIDEKFAKEFRNRLLNPPPLANFLLFLRSALDDIGLKIVEK